MRRFLPGPVRQQSRVPPCAVEVDRGHHLKFKSHILAALVGAIATHAGWTILSDTTSDAYHEVVQTIETDEGFRKHIYKDSRGYRTIGFGTNIDLGIDREEGEILLSHRLQKNGKILADKWPAFSKMPEEIQAVLVEMSYQLGPSRVLKFKKMLAALEKGDYKSASKEIQNSKWARETPARAKRAASVLDYL